MNFRYILFALLIMTVVMSCSREPEGDKEMNVTPLDLSKYSSEKQNQPLHLLFIHHSCGGQLFADKGVATGDNCINPTHPNGGGLRGLLEANNYIVHEASYGSIIGQDTDICHWNVKFRDHIEKILKCKNQDEFFVDSTVNTIVMFKSCFPNNWIESDGKIPGDPDSCKKTTANYQAAYNALLQYFYKQPNTLFVAVTAPPLVEPVLYKRDRLFDSFKDLLGRPDTVGKVGRRVRAFNNWLKDSENGWLKEYDLNNVVVFDLYDVLTGYGKSDWSMYGSDNGRDSHPNSEGNSLVAREFVDFLNKSVNRFRQ